jgi:hypothetical protein
MNNGEPDQQQHLISFNNKRIFDFYQQHSHLDIQHVNLTIIELFEKIIPFQTSDHASDQTPILDELSSVKKDIFSFIQDIIPRNNNEMYTQIQQHLTQFNSYNNLSINSAIDSKNYTILQRIQDSERTLTEQIKPRHAENHDRTLNELANYLGKINNSTIKGKIGENHLEHTLNSMFPSDEVLNTSSITASCDFKLLRKHGEPILIETKDYDRNVPTQEVSKFIRDIEGKQSNGLFLSQKSGISTKNNFQIDIIDKNVVIYIHFVEYNPQIIKIGIDIVDSISSKLNDFKTIENPEHSISNELLTQINTEYVAFAERKMDMIKLCKDFQNNIEKQLNSIQFPVLNQFLTPIFNQNSTFQKPDSLYKCDICNIYIGKTSRSLSCHKAKCRNKQPQQSTHDIIEPILTDM